MTLRGRRRMAVSELNGSLFKLLFRKWRQAKGGVIPRLVLYRGSTLFHVQVKYSIFLSNWIIQSAVRRILKSHPIVLKPGFKIFREIATKDNFSACFNSIVKPIHDICHLNGRTRTSFTSLPTLSIVVFYWSFLRQGKKNLSSE